jgi:uncharacterized protein YbjT (DUF2867 family)
MAKKIFLAGATGAVGRRMLPLLRAAGYEVTGTTRVASKAETCVRPKPSWRRSTFDAAALGGAPPRRRGPTLLFIS